MSLPAYDPQDMRDLATYFQISEHDARLRLDSFDRQEIAAAWSRTNPRSFEEQRKFYSETDLYIWELLKWNDGPTYDPYWSALNRITELWPSRSFPSVLDFGCGVGSAALFLARKGYRVTIADVPGKTLEFARLRFQSRQLPYEAIETTSDVPDFKRRFDVLICFDVLEHLPRPGSALFALSRMLRSGGCAALEATFDNPGEFPQHLPENIARFAETRNWWAFVNSAGLDPVADKLHRKVSSRVAWLRQLRFRLWMATGYFAHRLPRFKGDFAK